MASLPAPTTCRGQPGLATPGQTLTAGINFHRAGKLTEAAACYTAVLRVTPRNADALHMLGLVKAAGGELDRGIELIRQAVEIQPKFAPAWFNLGNLLRKQNRLPETVEAYRRAVARDPKLAEAHGNLGCVLSSLGRTEEAIAALRKAIAANRGYAEAHYNLGVLLEKQDKLEECAVELRHAVAGRPDHAAAWHDLGIVYRRLGNSAEARTALRRAVGADRRDAHAWLNLGAVEHEAGGLDRAAAAYREVIALRPGSLEAHYHLGRVLRAQGDLAAAIDCYQRAVAIEPRCANALNDLAVALLAQGKIDAAFATWQKADPLTALPEHPLIPDETTNIAIEKRHVAVETPWRRIEFEFSVIILTAPQSVTLCAPAFFRVATADSEAKAAQELAATIATKAGGSPLAANAIKPEETLTRHAVSDVPEHIFLFGRQLPANFRYREALECMRFARKLGLVSKHFFLAHGLMSALLGELDEAIALYTQAITLCCEDHDQPSRYGSSAMPEYLVKQRPIVDLPRLLQQASALRANNPLDAAAGSTAVDDTAKLLSPLLEIEALNQLAENLVNYHGAHEASRKIYQRRTARQEALLQSYGIEHQDTLFLSSDWTRNIGHIAYLDHLIRMRELGVAPWQHVVVLARADRIANSVYLDYWRKYVTVVTDPALIERFESLTTACGFRFSNLFPFAGREPVATFELGCAVEARWRERNQGALLTLRPEHEEAGWRALQARGLARTDWFVCLHVRETGYHPGAEQEHRNADVKTYFPAIRAITERGGWVIRLGDASMTPLPAMERVFDYPHSDLKSPEMDIFLAGACRFLIGSNSGMSHIPYSFGRPTVMANWVDTGSLPPFPRNGLFLPKLLRTETESRPLSFREILSATWRGRAYSVDLLRKHGARPVNNTAEEITDVVNEMLERLEGRHTTTEEDTALHENYGALLSNESLRGSSQIGTAFLRHHRELLR